MKTYMKVVGFVVLWVLSWSYLVAWEGKFDPGVNGPVGRKEFLEALGTATGQTAIQVADHIKDSLDRVDAVIDSTQDTLDVVYANVDTLYLYITADGDTLRIDSTFVAMLSMIVRGRLIAKDSMWIGIFEGTVFGDLNIKQTTSGGIAIKIEEASGQEAYGIGVSEQGDFALHDDDGSLTFWIRDGTNQVIVPDSLRVIGNSRVQGDVKMESDLNVQGQFTSTLNFDLELYYARNVVDLWGVDVYPTINNYAGGQHGDSLTYLTDNQSIGVVCASEASYTGMSYPLPDTNWTKTTDGDTIELADWYFLMALKMDSTSIARLPEDGFHLVVGSGGGGTNTYKHSPILRSVFSPGWNFLKFQLSSWQVNVGSPSWADIDSLWLLTHGAVSADGDLYFLVDHVQLVRGIDGEPNPLQREGPDGTWVADWTEEGAGNVWLVEESGVLSVFTPEAVYTISYLKSVKSYGDYQANGIWKVSDNPELFIYKLNHRLRLGNNVVALLDSSGVEHIKAFAFSTGDLIHWKFQRKGTSITGQVSHTGLSGDWTTVSTFGFAGVAQAELYFDNAQRIYSLGLSNVAYAAEAGVAQRLKNGLSFDLSSNLTTHGTRDGITARVDVDVNTIGFSGALHMDADGNLIDADADGTTTLPCMAMAIEAGVGSGKLVLLQGKMVNTSWNWTIGAPVFVSASAGDLSATVASGDYIQQVGIAIGADAIYFNPKAYDAVVVP